MIEEDPNTQSISHNFVSGLARFYFPHLKWIGGG